MNKNLIPLALCATFALPAVADEPVMTHDVSRLAMPIVVQLATNTIQSCEQQGFPVSVTVVDRNGLIQAKIRHSMAPPFSLNVSEKKAYTAVMFNMTGTALSERMANSALSQIDEGVAFMAGSLPIQAGGKLYGAIGVSGAPGGDLDEACAQAGIDSVIEDLEMM